MSTITTESSRGGGFQRGRSRFLPAAFGLALALGGLGLLALPAPAAPRLLTQTALERIPGEIVAWRDSTWYSVATDSLGGYRLVRGTLVRGEAWRTPLGPRGHGQFVSLSPDLKSVLVTEPDSLERRFLHLGTLPAPPARRAPGAKPAAGGKPNPGEVSVRWKALTPVTDQDPHVTWYASGAAFVYQDILDDSLGVPSLFVFNLTGQKPRLFLRGGQRPLLSPTDDAVVFVSVDTTRRINAKDVESYFPVGLDDMEAGDFRFVAPLRSWVPTRDAWSPDGQRVALIGYGTDSTGAAARIVHVYSRAGQATHSLTLPEDSGRPDRDHETDVAAWSPDARWIAVARAFGRGTSGDDPGWIWLVSPGGYDASRISPSNGSWRGAPLWIDRRKFVIADGGASGSRLRRYWIVEVAD